MSKVLFYTLAVLALSGCNATNPSRIELRDQTLLEPCETTQPLAGGSEEQVVDWAQATLKARHDCAAKHKALSTWVKKVIE